jgi:hypothetical protein
MVENELVNAKSFVQENNALFVLFKKDNQVRQPSFQT